MPPQTPLSPPLVPAAPATRRWSRQWTRVLWRTVCRNRLLQFLAIGGALFLIAPAPEDSSTVRISSSALAALGTLEAHRQGVPVLDDVQSRGLLHRIIEDEVLYREALRLGFDRDDGIVRRRLIEKVLFLAEDLGGTSRPVTEAELERHFAAAPERWRAPGALRFIHVYASEPRRDLLVQQRAAILASPGNEPPALGEDFPLSRAVALTPAPALADMYGEEFVSTIARLPVGTWSEPVRSKFGWHLVRVLEQQQEAVADFSRVREDVKLAYLVERRQKAIDDFLREAFSRYRLEVDGQRYTPATSGAVRLVRSGEVD